MSSCPECGLDVEIEGLCDECRFELKKVKIINNGNSTISGIYLVILILTGFLSGLIGILIGRILPGNNSANIVQNTKVEYLPDTADSTTEADILDEKVYYDISKRDKFPPLDNKETYVKWMLDHTSEDEFFIAWRWDCVQDLIRWKSITKERIKVAFLLTPRENFIRKRNLKRAYEHAYMPIGYGATITDPWVVSTMTEALNPGYDEYVLEIGTGSGYQSALLSQLSNHVFTIEIIDILAKETDDLYKTLVEKYPEYKNIRRKSGDGYFGWSENAQFDKIIVTCAIDHIPPALHQQLKTEGIMVIPIGPPSGQQLLKVTKHISSNGIPYFDREEIFSKTVHFIPFTKQGSGTYSQTEENEQN